MQQVAINYWAILVCGLASMVLGFLWYGPLFGKMWAKLSGHDSDKMNAAKQMGMHTMYILSFISALVMAWVLAHSLVFAESYLKISGLAAGLKGGFFNWLGFVVPITLSTVLWDGKPWKLWCLNSTYYLIQLLIFGAILASWR